MQYIISGGTRPLIGRLVQCQRSQYATTEAVELVYFLYVPISERLLGLLLKKIIKINKATYIILSPLAVLMTCTPKNIPQIQQN